MPDPAGQTLPIAGPISDHQGMFKTTFRDANGNQLAGPPFMQAIPAQGEAVVLQENATWKILTGVVTKRVWHLHAEDQEACEVVISVALDPKKR